MKKYSNFSIICLAAALALTSCTQDEPEGYATTLPDGEYPLLIGSVSIAAESSKEPSTRVSEITDGSSSVWETGDEFYVKFEGSDQVGTYRITDATAGTVEAVNPAYWTNTSTEQTIIAWYAPKAKEDGTIDVSDQTDGLAYVISDVRTATYNENTSISFQFTHQLAKVRVYLKGTAYDEGNIKGVTLSYPASYTLTNGKVTQATGTTNGTIQMYKAENATYYEALVLPGTIAASGNPFTVTLDDDKTAEVNLSADLTLSAANRHDVTLAIHKSGTQVIDLSTLTGTYTIADSNPYWFYNSAGAGSYGISVTSGTPDIYLDNATISVSSGNGINITGGTPTIHVVGENNSVTSSNGAGIYVASGSTVNITSTNRSNVLTAKGGNGGSGIGACDQACGNIAITNVTVKAHGSKENAVTSICFSARIGGSGNNACGTITINNAVIYAYGATEGVDGNFSTPGIGGGLESASVATYGTITIKNASEVYVQRGSSKSDYIGSAGCTTNPASSTDGIDAQVDNTSTVSKLTDGNVTYI